MVDAQALRTGHVGIWPKLAHAGLAYFLVKAKVHAGVPAPALANCVDFGTCLNEWHEGGFETKSRVLIL